MDVVPGIERRARLEASYALLAAAVLALATGLLVRHTGPVVRLELGAFDGPLAEGSWTAPLRANVVPEEAADGITSFYYRGVSSHALVSLPLTPRSEVFRLDLRALTRVRTEIDVFLSGRPVGSLLVRRNLWDRYGLTVPASAVRGSALEMGLGFVPRPLVSGVEAEDAQPAVDYLEVTDESGFTLSPSATVLLSSVPVALVLLSMLVGGGPWASLGVGGGAAALVVVLARLAPLSMILAVPRLLPVALASGGLAYLALSRQLDVEVTDRRAMAGLVVSGIVLHGSLAFFPNHNPPNLETHIARTLDLGGVPFEYRALLRYGSHLPTESQIAAPATAHFGERTLVPYSPVPYFGFYALHRRGVDLHWGMTVATVVLLMAVAPWLWYVASRVWNRSAAWVAALLYVLDLAIWHHVGRCDNPSSVGTALSTAALLFLLLHVAEFGEPRRVLTGAALLAGAALGYSSVMILLGFFGVTLLSLLAMDAGSLSARKGLALSLVIGGLLAGGLYYFHYVPGLLKNASGVEFEPDLFPGRTFLIFHNESRQTMRIWNLGYWVTCLGGLVAAPLAWLKTAPERRPILASWFGAWAFVMLFKEPFLFPKLLRWAKEEQFLSPLLCLLIGGALGTLRPGRGRWLLAALVLGIALWIETRDFLLHANTLFL